MKLTLIKALFFLVFARHCKWIAVAESEMTYCVFIVKCVIEKASCHIDRACEVNESNLAKILAAFVVFNDCSKDVFALFSLPGYCRAILEGDGEIVDKTAAVGKRLCCNDCAVYLVLMRASKAFLSWNIRCIEYAGRSCIATAAPYAVLGKLDYKVCAVT